MSFIRKKRETTSMDRLPPHDGNAEQSVLGCILLDPVMGMGHCADTFKSQDVFYDLRNQTIYGTMVKMMEKLIPIDLVTLCSELKNLNVLDEIGGQNYIVELPNTTPSAHAIESYISIVHDKFLLRGMIQACSHAVENIYDYQGEVSAIMDEVERDILRVRQASVVNKTDTVRQLVQKSIQAIEDMTHQSGHLTGVPTGYSDLDKMTWGFQPGEMIVIAARPSMGKTSLAMNIVESVAVHQELPVGVFSLEMTAQSLMMRMLCSRARVNLRNVREGFLAERDYPKITNAAAKLASSPIHIDDSSGLSIQALRAKARRMHHQYGIRLFVIDYLQLLNNATSRRRDDNRQQEVADISSGIKGLAKELNVPIVVLSQLNRDIEREKNRRPRLSDLRESGAVEQDADVVGLLYKPTTGEDDDGPEDQAVAVNLLIAKQRNGPTGDVNLTFLKTYTRFESAAKVADNDIPENDHQQTFRQHKHQSNDP